MSKKAVRDGFHVEWINITYRSVATLVLGAALLIGGGGSFWYYKNRLEPKKDAQAAIERASTRLSQALVLPLDESLRQMVGRAEVHLTMARTEFTKADFDNSSFAAMRSEDLSLKVIGTVGGPRSESRLAKMNRVEGNVRVKQAGSFSWSTAEKGMTLRTGDQVKTSSSSTAEVIYFDGTVTRIQPGSLLEIRDLFEDPVTKVRRVREKLSWGEILASTQKQIVSGSYHEVAVGALSARSEVTGKFRVAIDENDGTSVVDVFDGKVELFSPGTRETVRSGERIRAAADGKLFVKEALPGVPRLITPSDQRVFIFENPANESVTLNWAALPKIRRFRLLISEMPLFTTALYDAERDDLSAVIDGINAGTYHWKVAAISGSGVAGPFSEARSFRVSSRRIRDRSDTEPPKLKIIEFVTLGRMVIINGQTEPGATLWVDNNKVDVDDEGLFSTVVRLRQEGLNELKFVAQDTAGNQSTVRRNAYVEVY